MINAEEVDMLSRARGYVGHKPGRAKAAKRSYNKRQRKQLALHLKHEY
jgi:hypothetical protein